MAVAIDFETYWSKEYAVTDAGPWAYVADPRFECYQVAICGDDRDGKSIEWVGEPKDAPWQRIEGCVWVSHNMTFDAVVWSKLREKLPAVSAPKAPHWYCTANLSVYLQAPRNLEGAAAALLGTAVPKDYRAMMKGRHVNELMAYDLEEVRKAGLADARAALEIWRRYGRKWPLHERNLSLMTFQIANRGLAVDWSAVDRAIDVLKRQNWEAAQKLPWVEDGRPPLSVTAVREQCRSLGIPAPTSLAMDSDECGEWEDRFGEAHPFVGAMRVWRRTNMLLKKLELMRAMRRPDGSMPAILRYCGAPHTGRWSGDLVNLQNLPRGGMFGVSLRECIVPPAGMRFVISDLCQIEPRVLALLSGDKALLAALANGMPLYEAHARETMGWAPEAPAGSDQCPAGSEGISTGSEQAMPLKKADPKLYALAKARVLGLGYGCSAARFAKVAKTLAGLDLTPEECRRTVKDFRKRNPLITGLWGRFDRAIAAAARSDKQLEMELPSGRVVRYFDVAYDTQSRSYTACTERGGSRERVYGAKLVENLVQGTAREIFADMLLRIRDAGIQVTFHVHDEVICQVPAERVEQARAEIEAIMRTPPAWMKGLPLAVESCVGDRYGK